MAVQLAVVTIGICLCFEEVQCVFYDIGVKYKISLNVFSGRDNPEWEIDSANPLYGRVSWLVNDSPPTKFDECLGYQGFTVQATNALRQTAVKTVGKHTNRRLESTLLRSCPSTYGLSQSVFNHVNSGIHGQSRQVSGIKAGPRPMTQVTRVTTITANEEEEKNIVIKQRIIGGRKKRQAFFCATRFQPQNWNYPPVQRRNNCYNYATNMRTNTFAQPGRGSGRRFRRRESSDVYEACVRDGLTRLSGPDAGPECLTALVIWPGEDYHFYRLDNNGYWSHKSGRTAARDVDNSGVFITDPLIADRGPYTDFAGWLGVGPNVYIR